MQQQQEAHTMATVASDAPVYTHRNGESEPPTETGWYWFRGNVGGEPYADSVTILKTVWSDELRAVAQERLSPYLQYWIGEWYGPIVPPWDTPPATLSPTLSAQSVDVAMVALVELKFMTSEKLKWLRENKRKDNITIHGIGMIEIVKEKLATIDAALAELDTHRTSAQGEG